MAGIPWPGTDEDAAASWDAVLMGGHLLPGRCTVDVDGEMDIDKGKAAKQHGANIKFNGYKPRQITLTWILTERRLTDGTVDPAFLAEWDTMQDILTEWEPITGKKDVTPLQFINSKTAVRGVYSVAIEKISGPDYAEGEMTVKMTIIEWNKPSATGTKGTGTAKGDKAVAPGSEWEQAPNSNGEIETTATKSAPHKKETKP